MKILSMYLPQFHRVKENDEWWGKGYTDWVSARNAQSLFAGHYQPHIPQNQYYYDLMDKSTFEWQADLMKRYGIDGQCIYHYWFKDGRQILEKPVENLLKWKEIDMPFCFSWANQSWANSWSAIKNVNVWCDERETKQQNDNDNGLLLEQQYGGEREWRSHFEYLLNFFKDSRYIKFDNKPVFVLYQAKEIIVLEEMVKCWNFWAKKEGFDGIFFVGAKNRDESLVDAVLDTEPQTAMHEMLQTLEYQELKILDYKDVWEKIIDKAYMENNHMVGAFVGYDDTPRRGHLGYIIDHASPKIFRKYFTKLLAIQTIHNQPFMFINAWNEWGEGMHLEPDEKDGLMYLEAVSYAKKHYKEYLSEVINAEDSFYAKNRKTIAYYQNKMDRYESYWRVMDKWLSLKEKGKTIKDILIEKNIYTIVIYGVGMLGKHLISDLSDGDVKIICAIDRNNVKHKYQFPVLSIDEEIPMTDAIIVTPSYDYPTIKRQLNKKGMNNVISIESLFDL